jgi:DNA-binding GntR family transcriptional regulator
MSEQPADLIRERVYRDLRRDILACRIRPGSGLNEPELAQRFAVSKSPVRDALLRLEADRLVEVQPRRGYRVLPVSLADAQDLFDFRALVEPACAQSAAAHADEAALRGLDRFRSLEAFGAPAAPFVLYNREFHLAIAALCTNRRVGDTARDLIEQFDRLVTVSLHQTAEAGQAVLIAEHVEIIEALQARQGRQAARILSGHVGRARKRVLAALAAAAVVA